MKKISLSLVLVAGIAGFTMGLNAATLDKNSAKVDFKGYKLANKVGVPGTFKDVVFIFNNTSGSIAEILKDAKATVDFNKIDTHKNPVRDNNIKTKLVKFMVNPEIEVLFGEVKGDDMMGEIVSKITMNQVTKDAVFKYEVKDGKIVASSTIKPTDFMPEAFDKFKKDPIISALHGKITYDEVLVTFSADVK